MSKDEPVSNIERRLLMEEARRWLGSPATDPADGVGRSGLPTNDAGLGGPDGTGHAGVGRGAVAPLPLIIKSRSEDLQSASCPSLANAKVAPKRKPSSVRSSAAAVDPERSFAVSPSKTRLL
jgi:hypothetical protein